MTLTKDSIIQEDITSYSETETRYFKIESFIEYLIHNRCLYITDEQLRSKLKNKEFDDLSNLFAEYYDSLGLYENKISYKVWKNKAELLASLVNIDIEGE